jgi:gas vesicle protein
VSKFVSFVTGAMLGMLVGGLLGLLLTPFSGEELRQQASQAANSRREELQHRLAELRTPRPPSAA